MSLSLAALLAMSLALVVLSVIRPTMVFQYPIVVGFLFLGWVVPQAWATERLDLLGNVDLSIVWLYMLACLVCIVLGFRQGAKTQAAHTASAPDQFLDRFDLKKLSYGCLALIIFGAVSFILMGRQAEVDQLGSEWTGVATLYSLFSQALVYGAALSWLVYLRTDDRRMLALTIIAFIIFIPVVLFAVKRSAAFEMAIIFFLGSFFVHGKTPSRLTIAAGAIIGTILVHQVGELRYYIEHNHSSAVEAIMDGAATRNFSVLTMERAPEISGAAVDIFYTEKSGNYKPFVSIWNGLVHQYVPAFILGQEFKDGLKFQDSLQDQFFMSRGATRTGFSDSFRSFWYFGVLCYFAIAYGFGRLWSGALAGDVRAQFFYIILMNDGLIALTESVSRFVAALPFLLLVTWLPFYFAKRDTVPAQGLRPKSGRLAATGAPWRAP